MQRETLMSELRKSGQIELVEQLDALAVDERERLESQLATFDFDLVRKLSAIAQEGQSAMQVGEFEPAPVVRANRAASEISESRRVGEQAFRAGEVAAFVVAGGQGSRLRFEGPKGCFKIGPVSQKTLFQIHAEKIRAANVKYKTTIPLYIMTSEANDAAVRGFFSESNFFGLSEADVFFCIQRMLPAFDAQGKILRDAPCHVFCSPDGHGGSFFALQRSGAFAELSRRGIKYISYFQVDNPIVRAIDPVFLGEHIRAGSEMSSKVLAKREPLEKLGIFGYVDSELRVIEYSDMSEALQRKTLPDGSLKYAFGSIAIHMINAGFAARMADVDLPFHVAFKRVPYCAPDGKMVEPSSPNAYKFERFVFDAIPLARNPLVLEVLRDEEFAPVKNFSGDDSPETTRAAMVALHTRWLEAAGVNVPQGALVEISPLFALDEGDVRAKAASIHPARIMYLE